MRPRRRREPPTSNLADHRCSRYFFLGRVDAAPFIFDRAGKLTAANLQWLKHGFFSQALYFRSIQAVDDESDASAPLNSNSAAHHHHERVFRATPFGASSASSATTKRRKVIDLTLESDEEADIVSLPTPPPSSPPGRSLVPPTARKRPRKDGSGQKQSRAWLNPTSHAF